MARMAAASIQSSNHPEMTAAPIKTQMMTLVNCDSRSVRIDVAGASGSSFGPL